MCVLHTHTRLYAVYIRVRMCVAGRAECVLSLSLRASRNYKLQIGNLHLDLDLYTFAYALIVPNINLLLVLEKLDKAITKLATRRRQVLDSTVITFLFFSYSLFFFFFFLIKLIPYLCRTLALAIIPCVPCILIDRDRPIAITSFVPSCEDFVLLLAECMSPPCKGCTIFSFSFSLSRPKSNFAFLLILLVQSKSAKAQA